MYGTAAANLLEAEIVTADGAVWITNAATNPDLFWALKGGGGGTFGVVTRLTLRTHELPTTVGAVNAVVHAHTDTAFRRLIGRFVAFYAERLATPQWSDIVTIGRNNRLNIGMGCLGLDQAQAEAIWQPFFAWVAAAGDDYSFVQPSCASLLPRCGSCLGTIQSGFFSNGSRRDCLRARAELSVRSTNRRTGADVYGRNSDAF